MTQGKATEEVHSSFKLSLSWGWVPWSRGDLLCIDTFHFCKAGSGSPLWAAACNQVQWKMWFWGWWCYLQVRKTGDCIQGTHTPPFSHFAVVASPQDMQAWVFCTNLSLFFHLFCSQKLQWELSSNWQSIWISFWKHAGFRGNVHRWKSDTCKWYHWRDNWWACWENICEKQVKIAKLFLKCISSPRIKRLHSLLQKKMQANTFLVCLCVREDEGKQNLRFLFYALA